MHNQEKPKRIHLLGKGLHEEAVSAEGSTIIPGQLVQVTGQREERAHPPLIVNNNVGAGAVAEKLFALEDALQGRTIGDNYEAETIVSLVVAGPGDVVYAWLAAGEDVDAGDKLSSAGSGALKEASGTDVRLAVALEDIDNSETGAEPVRIRARVL